MKKKFSVEHIVGVLKQAEVGVPIAELIRKVGLRSRPTIAGRPSMPAWKWISSAKSNSFVSTVAS